MDYCSNINTDICYGKILHNTSVMHSKSIACGCGCRGSVKVSSEVFKEKGRYRNIATKQLIKVSHLCLCQSANFMHVSIFFGLFRAETWQNGK